MPILTPTDLYGCVEGLYLNPSREAGMRSNAVERVTVTYEGFDGEAHGGLTRPSCSRVKAQYPKGTEIRNTRQIAVMSQEELSDISNAMGIDGIDPTWIGTNLLLSGLPMLTQLPPASRLIFEGGASLVVDMENGPCKFAAQEIEAERPEQGMSFVTKAKGRRGITAWVERDGSIELGEACRLHIPPQRIYAPAVKEPELALSNAGD